MSDSTWEMIPGNSDPRLVSALWNPRQQRLWVTPGPLLSIICPPARECLARSRCLIIIGGINNYWLKERMKESMLSWSGLGHLLALWEGKCLVIPSCPSLSATLWTVAHQAPLSMGFPRQEYWSGLPFPSLGDLPDPGIEPVSLALSGRFYTGWAIGEAMGMGLVVSKWESLAVFP